MSWLCWYISSGAYWFPAGPLAPYEGSASAVAVATFNGDEVSCNVEQQGNNSEEPFEV